MSSSKTECAIPAARLAILLAQDDAQEYARQQAEERKWSEEAVEVAVKMAERMFDDGMKIYEGNVDEACAFSKRVLDTHFEDADLEKEDEEYKAKWEATADCRCETCGDCRDTSNNCLHEKPCLCADTYECYCQECGDVIEGMTEEEFVEDDCLKLCEACEDKAK